jgi:hypothetical protein
MTKWTFRNWTHGKGEIPVASADHAVELLMEHSGWTEYGVVLEYTHAELGCISCVANTEFSTLDFNPIYNRKAHSLLGKRCAIRVKPVRKDQFLFVDSVGVASSIPLRYVLPILKVTRALKYIIEHHEFPSLIRWSDAVPDEQ